MSETDGQPPIIPAGAPAPSPAEPQFDAAEIEELRANYAQAQAVLERLGPHADIIKRIVESDDDRSLAQKAWEARDKYVADQQPKVPAEIQPLYDKVSRLDEFVSKYEKQQEDIATAPQRELANKWQEWQASPTNDRFYRKLKQDVPELNARDVQYLAQIAAEHNFEPLEETWKRDGWRVAPNQGASPPPSSLRTDAGDIGIPGATAPPAAQGMSMRDRIVQDLRRQRGIA